MTSNRTLTIIKPDAFGSGHAGLILAHLEKGGFALIAARVMRMSRDQASEFYAVHRGRPFYADLVTVPLTFGARPCEGEASTGYCLPGDPVPLLLYPPEITLTGTALEVGVIVALAAIFP